MDFLQNKFFLLALTFGFYLLAQLLQRRTGIKLLNPILIAIAAMISFLMLFDIDYDTYKQGGDYIDFWLKPAVVALGASREIVVSLAPKAVTTPIAMEISSAMGGIAPLTAAVVVATGIFGGMTGFKIVKMSHIHSPIAEGLSIGTAAHAVGTSAAMERSERYGAFSSIGLTLNGLFTALLAPMILELLGYSV